MTKIINLRDVKSKDWASPGGKFGASDLELSIALGRKPESLDLGDRHPFDVIVSTVPAGKAACPYHAHSAQFEYYQVLSGKGRVRSESGIREIVPGDCFVFKPGEAHQLLGGENEAVTVILVADNPLGESCYYPDSKKWIVHAPEDRLIRSEPLEYLDGEKD
ncbi:MAG: cupin domain-containing protein [Opitutaceae bacterium]|nr:cupin domain-containing protein [Opitutaceae bacterium]